MYILYECTYDYYEWLDAKYISSSVGTLVDQASHKNLYKNIALTEEDHIKFKEQEHCHYWITEIEQI